MLKPASEASCSGSGVYVYGIKGARKTLRSATGASDIMEDIGQIGIAAIVVKNSLQKERICFVV